MRCRLICEYIWYTSSLPLLALSFQSVSFQLCLSVNKMFFVCMHKLKNVNAIMIDLGQSCTQCILVDMRLAKIFDINCTGLLEKAVDF